MYLSWLLRQPLPLGILLSWIRFSTASPQATPRYAASLAIFNGVDEVMCHRRYGNELWEELCVDAIDQMPTGDIAREYRSNPGVQGLKVPLQYGSYNDNAECYVRVDVTGAVEDPNPSITVSPNTVAQRARDILNQCVVRDVYKVGGINTIGLDAVARHIATTGAVQRHGVYRDKQVLKRLIDSLNEKKKNLTTKNPTQASFRSSIDKGLDALDQERDELNQSYPDEPPREEAGHRVATHRATRGVPRNVKYDCMPTLGSPSASSCEHVLYELQDSGGINIDPSTGPVLKASGDCAIAISATKKTWASWSVLKAASAMLISQCVTAPLAAHVGGVATAEAMPHRGTAALTGLAATLAAGVRIAMYNQQAYSGNANDTCALGVFRNHTGDVRQCNG